MTPRKKGLRMNKYLTKVFCKIFGHKWCVKDSYTNPDDNNMRVSCLVCLRCGFYATKISFKEGLRIPAGETATIEIPLGDNWPNG